MKPTNTIPIIRLRRQDFQHIKEALSEGLTVQQVVEELWPDSFNVRWRMKEATIIGEPWPKKVGEE